MIKFVDQIDFFCEYFEKLQIWVLLKQAVSELTTSLTFESFLYLLSVYIWSWFWHKALDNEANSFSDGPSLYLFYYVQNKLKGPLTIQLTIFKWSKG